MDNTYNIMDNVSDLDLKKNSKKSILIDRCAGGGSTASLRRGTSKTQNIQWKEVPGKMEEEQRKMMKASLPVLGLLASRGYRWHFIHDAMLKLRWEEMKHTKQTDEEMQSTPSKGINSLIEDLGSNVLQKRYNKDADLSLEQQVNLEILMHKVKAENDAYLRKHPEIDIMIKLVYTALFKSQPKQPKEFVADFVHYLNKHREELVVEEVDIPFDRPPTPEEITEESEDDERRQVREFAKQIVESCVNIAALGESYVDVMGILNSMLKVVLPSESEIPAKMSISSAETAVEEVLMSILTSVAIEKSTSAEIIVDQVLSIILSKALPFVDRGSKEYADMKGSVENFIQQLLQQVTDNAITRINAEDILEEKEGQTVRKKFAEQPAISILKKDISVEDFTNNNKHETKTKVKFQSL